MNFENFENTLQKYLKPIAVKLENQKHLQAIKDGMMAAIPILIVGSFCLIPVAIGSLLPAGGIKDFILANQEYFKYPAAFTTDIISIFMAYSMADCLARSYGMKTKANGIIAIAVQFILCTTKVDGAYNLTYLGSRGIFTAIVSSFMVVEVTRLMRNKNIVIRMPSSVPPMVSDSMSALLPAFVEIILATVITCACVNLTGGLFPALLESFLAPITAGTDTLLFTVLIVLFCQLLWFLGMHGTSISGVIWKPFAMQFATENIANFASGQPVEHIFTGQFFLTMLMASGAGLTIGLVILCMRSKSKTLKAIGKVSILPGCFGINEPLIYGLPIVMNPYMFVPFVFGPAIISAIDYLAIALGIVGKQIVQAPGFMPPGVGAFLMTLDWKAFVLVIFTIVLMTLFYYPFFKAMEKNEIEKEKKLEESSK